MIKRQTLFRILNYVFIGLAVLSCGKSGPEEGVSRLKEIRNRGQLIAVTDYNSTNYFIYRGKPMGYQYDLLKKLANEIGVELRIKVNKDLDESFNLLNKGECDIMAFNLTITEERKNKIDFTIPHTQARQVLVQRKPEGWSKMSQGQMDRKLIRNQLELKGKVIWVRSNSSYAQRLKNLSEEIGGGIKIVEKDKYIEEQLIALVSKGEIDFTVCDENLAKVNSTYYPNIDVKTAISFPQNLAWGVKKGADSLRLFVNEWLQDYKKTLDYALIYNKYYKNRRSAIIRKSEYYTISSGKISPYDPIIKKYSKKVEWDWRLIASLIFQESRFNPKAQSWAGAKGLMQLMPSVAERFNVPDRTDPQQNIRGGIELLDWLDQRLKKKGIKDEEARLKFILASYNVGMGHILDARRLAKKYGKDPDKWENNVDEFILKKSNPKYYKDEVVYYGYRRGTETYNYVRQILDRYEHYKNLIESG